MLGGGLEALRKSGQSVAVLTTAATVDAIKLLEVLKFARIDSIPPHTTRASSRLIGFRLLASIRSVYSSTVSWWLAAQAVLIQSPPPCLPAARFDVKPAYCDQRKHFAYVKHLKLR